LKTNHNFAAQQRQESHNTHVFQKTPASFFENGDNQQIIS